MVLLATIRKYQLCNRLLCMKRTVQAILLSKRRLNKHDIFRNLSTNDNSNRTQSKKGTDQPPERPEKDICCGTGCNNCVWFKYLVEVRFYYEDDKNKILEAFNAIPDPDVKAFVETEFRKAYRKALQDE